MQRDMSINHLLPPLSGPGQVEQLTGFTNDIVYNDFYAHAVSYNPYPSEKIDFPKKNTAHKNSTTSTVALSGNTTMEKPCVGSEEWYKAKRLSHKEVERRRREAISEGIKELANIVPGCEKNKGSILQRTAQYIRSLKEMEEMCREKSNLEKLVADHTIQELARENARLKSECERAWRSVELWKQAARSFDSELDVEENSES